MRAEICREVRVEKSFSNVPLEVIRGDFTTGDLIVHALSLQETIDRHDSLRSAYACYADTFNPDDFSGLEGLGAGGEGYEPPQETESDRLHYQELGDRVAGLVEILKARGNIASAVEELSREYLVACGVEPGMTRSDGSDYYGDRLSDTVTSFNKSLQAIGITECQEDRAG